MPINSFSLYYHIPFCESLCGYCDFCKVPLNLRLEKGRARLREYVELLKREVRLQRERLGEAVWSASVYSVFFGGGTPSLLEPYQIAELLSEEVLGAILEEGAEVTVEANPDTLNEKKVQGYREAGVTRLSVGVQSFDSSVLRTLERFHSPEQVVKAVEWAKDSGLEVSLDLIYGAPGETLGSWEETVLRAISLQPDHISAYALTLEPKVRLARKVNSGKVEAVSEDEQALKYELADRMLSEAGYEWYEISNWAHSKVAQSHHNLAYWENRNWLGLGAGAHSHILRTAPSGEVLDTRFWNTDSVADYEARLSRGELAVIGEEVLSRDQRQLEAAMMAARLNRAIDSETWGSEAVFKLKELGLIDRLENRPTVKGRMLADEVTRILDSSPTTPPSTRACPLFQTSECRSCPQCVV